MKHRIILLSLIILITQACKNRENALDVPGYEMTPGYVEISKEAMGDIILNISSPIEMAYLIKDMGLAFSSDNLTDISDIDSYSSSFKMAYMLGILGADLGYLNVYGKTGSSISYLSAINRLADGLKVSRFFDFNTIKRLAGSNSGLDSLVFISVYSFNEMDNYLRETDRSNLSALMITGAWLEGMFQVTRVLEEKHNDELAEYLGEQKLILNDLILMLKNYEQDEQFALIIKDYEDLKSVFKGVKISYEITDPEPVEQEDGSLMIVQNETSIVDISPEVLNQIIEKTSFIRSKHLKMR